MEGYSLEVLKAAREQLPFVSENKLLQIIPGDTMQEHPRRLGIVLSGGPAPGGHNVIAGVFEAAKRAHPDNVLIGFLAGPKGIIINKHKEVTGEMIGEYKIPVASICWARDGTRSTMPTNGPMSANLH